ncbi:MAG: (4Fe-4S)-binding protein [Candidatus Syntrophoarchaeum caldarius]|uniref:(4Fe-4S)-binding protein n=1 Tax=Candidatus Syntropharchaeum caldarium TaxID=1838285 RepID=A0A1F2P929_9EURY|nr:MAG: (4Fe-4S)-binding protein [Candidatus Syntrophoarchaeum caldarius]
MIISIASGKGGTGKTTVAVNLALSLENENLQLLDCDVEEPNAHIFLNLTEKEVNPVYTTVPIFDKLRCNFCGECSRFCQFNAIFVIGKNPGKGVKGDVIHFPELCHGCMGCMLVCPRDAISEGQRIIGEIAKGKGEEGIDLVYGTLNIGEAMAVPLVRAVKREIRDEGTVIIDSPPGTSCPVIASVKDSDYCILVTEPTPFGLYDLKIAVKVLRKLEIPFGVVINRSGIGDRGVYDYCNDEGIDILLEIPYLKEIAESYSKGIPFIKVIGNWQKQFLAIFERIRSDYGVTKDLY